MLFFYFFLNIHYGTFLFRTFFSFFSNLGGLEEGGGRQIHIIYPSQVQVYQTKPQFVYIQYFILSF